MQTRMRNSGMTLIELVVVIAIIGILTALAGPQIFKVLFTREVVLSAAKELVADLRAAQTEGIRQGSGGVMVNGILVKRSVFVVFDTALNSYRVFRYEDTDGDNIRETDDVISEVATSKSLTKNVQFGTLSGVDKRACENSDPAPVNFVTFSDSNKPPCDGHECLEMDDKGFTKGINGTIYLTNNEDAYAVSVNAAGLMSICRWDEGIKLWRFTR